MDFPAELKELGLANLGLWEELYAQYQVNPNQVDPSWRTFFSTMEQQLQSKAEEQIPLPPAVSPTTTSPPSENQAYDNLRIFFLIQAYRTHGYLMAAVDPLQDQPPQEPAMLRLANLGFRAEELTQLFPTRGLLEKEKAPLKEIIEVLKQIYCGKIGFEYMGVENSDLEKWLQKKIESPEGRAPLSIEQKQLILQHLNKSELFESFLHTKYVGQKRFSLEGAETLIPMMAAVIETGSTIGLEEFVLGMAHRGRLNVLSNILNKSYAEVFAEFDENYVPDLSEGSGDVKYHKGFSAELLTSQGHRVFVSLAANPSHLESVDAVVEGKVRALQKVKNDLEHQERVLPFLVHGDAALSGQGVVYETMELSRLRGYTTGGTLHIVINNHIGFTTLPEDTRSTLYCTDIARAFDAPVFHVNAEDPEGCVFAANLAIEIRQKFHCDVFIDLNCYRKYGHNEGDEPAFTQPLVYKKIKQKKSIREIYRDELVLQGVLEKFLVQELETEFKKALQIAIKGTAKFQEEDRDKKRITDPEKDAKKLFDPVSTGVPLSTLRALAHRFCSIPKEFHIHPKLENLLKERLRMVQEGNDAKPVDWGMAEHLAYASLLTDGTPIRLTGQDSSRGTFSHRHGMWVDQSTQANYYPLAHLNSNQASFDLYNSPLSEMAALGFEFGYSLGAPEALVIWEAQFGDFVNGAQIIIDQYISPSEQKWRSRSNLVLYLPHGYEGQGPEHSSARIERFLNLAGNNNMFITNPTVPHQLFHLLRRQIKGTLKKPLIVFTPKALLRLPECTSPIEEFTKGAFQEILDDSFALPKKVTRVAFCSGRVYYDLQAERKKKKAEDIALIRIEQLYPLHEEKITELLAKYNSAKKYLWIQEEPYNMGGWHYMHPFFVQLLPKGSNIEYVGRARSASPATGFHAIHKQELTAILEAVFPDKEKILLDQEYMQRV